MLLTSDYMKRLLESLQDRGPLCEIRVYSMLCPATGVDHLSRLSRRAVMQHYR
jgi:uracil phosphoribosyltransferase